MLQTMLVPFNIVTKLVLSRYNEKQTSFFVNADNYLDLRL